MLGHNSFWRKPITQSSALHVRLRLVPYLAFKALERRYAGSILGPIWALVFPALQVGVYWAVLVFGLKVRSEANLSLAVTLISGITPWFLFSDALSNMTTSISSNPSMVKRLVLPVEIMPLSTLMAAFIVHGFILVVAVAALWTLGSPPSVHLLMLPLFSAALAVLTLPLGILLAIANAAFRDVSQIVASLLTLGLWATPIFWSIESLPLRLAWIGRLNPLDYVIQGYRYCLTGGETAAPAFLSAAIFWPGTLALGLAALVIFRRYSRNLADQI
jgi:teichoic acid transport system permease protein